MSDASKIDLILTLSKVLVAVSLPFMILCPLSYIIPLVVIEKRISKKPAPKPPKQKSEPQKVDDIFEDRGQETKRAILGKSLEDDTKHLPSPIRHIKRTLLEKSQDTIDLDGKDFLPEVGEMVMDNEDRFNNSIEMKIDLRKNPFPMGPRKNLLGNGVSALRKGSIAGASQDTEDINGQSMLGISPRGSVMNLPFSLNDSVTGNNAKRISMVHHLQPS
jgi:hypothetical protein